MLTEQQKTLVETYLEYAIKIAEGCLFKKEFAYDYAVDSLMVAAVTYDPSKSKFTTYLKNTIEFARMSRHRDNLEKLSREIVLPTEELPETPVPTNEAMHRVLEAIAALDKLDTVPKRTKELYKKLITRQLEGASLVEISEELGLHRNQPARLYKRIKYYLNRDNT